ncbi:hypothetical protein MMC31_006425 [Peltigera leucophlebia]|nr:hypothetical protein [Peltigera leucophlebia]
MSLGFSLSDVKLAYDLGKLIYDKCFTKANRADVRYFEFGKEIQTLAESLEQLIEVTENAWKQQNAGRQRQPRPLRPWGVARQEEQRGPEAELKSLREVTGDFSLTLNDCDALLRNQHKFHRDQAGFVDNVFWHASTESEISNLKERVRLHIAKMSFVIKPFEIQLLVGIRNELIQLQQDVRDLAGLMISLSKDTTRDTALPSLPSIEMPSTPDVITKRFVAALDLNRPDAFRGISDFPLKEGFDALVFHFAKSTVLFNPGVGVGPSRKVPKETQYLNLLKAKWILEKLKASSELAAAAETDSLWLNCEREVELEVMEQCRRFETKRLTPPPLDNITRLPDDCFTIWIFEPPPVQPHLAEARALEEKILDLILPNHASLTIFRISDDDFRVVRVHTTITPETSKEVERESFSVNMQSTQLVPAYAIPKTIPPVSPSDDILLHRAPDLSQWQRLKDLEDVFSFQQALTGYRVYFDASNIKWSLNGSDEPGKCGLARVQLWEAKRLSKLPSAEDSDQSPLSSVNSSTPSPQPSSENGFGQRRWTGLSSTKTSSSRTSQIAGNRACNATVVHPPEPPVLIIYTLCDGKFTFLHLTFGEEIFVNESACLCKKSPTTCLRIVLSSKNKKIRFRKHCASESGSEGLDSWDLARFRIPRHPRYKDIEVVEKEYLCLDFLNKTAKAEFRDELRSLFKYVRDPDIQEYRMEIIKKRQTNNRRTDLHFFS